MKHWNQISRFSFFFLFFFLFRSLHISTSSSFSKAKCQLSIEKKLSKNGFEKFNLEKRIALLASWIIKFENSWNIARRNNEISGRNVYRSNIYSKRNTKFNEIQEYISAYSVSVRIRFNVMRFLSFFSLLLFFLFNKNGPSSKIPREKDNRHFTRNCYSIF